MVTKALSLMSAPRRIRSAEVKRVNESNFNEYLLVFGQWTFVDARAKDVRIEDDEILKEEIERDGR